MCTTQTQPTAAQVEFVRNAKATAIYGPGYDVGGVRVGRDLYCVVAEALADGTRVRFLKEGGGESAVRVTAAARVCTCKGFHFSKSNGCRHLTAYDAIAADLFAAGDDRETVTDGDAVCEEYDAHYAGYTWDE